MRVLALNDENTREYTAFTVIDASYSEEYKGVEFQTPDGFYFHIENVSIQDSNYICKELSVNGFCDVTMFGIVECE